MHKRILLVDMFSSISSDLLADDERFAVPVTVPQLCTKRVLTAELVHGLPLDQCHHLSQSVRNDVSKLA